MRVTADARVLLDGIAAAHVAAADDTLHDIQTSEVKRTGRLARSFKVTTGSGRLTGSRTISIYSDVIYADAVERGANARVKGSVKAGTKRRGIYQVVNGKRKRVGFQAGPLLNRASRRGPHMAGNHIVAEQGPRFLEHMTSRLRNAQ